MTSTALFSSATDNWPTPVAFYDRLDAEFAFVLDVCSSVANHKAPTYYALDHPDTARRDGLAANWAADAAEAAATQGGLGEAASIERGTPAVWMNPPYGLGIGEWMRTAVETADAGCVVVCLVPVRAGSQWFHDHVFGSGAEVRYVRGRLKFGDATSAAPFDSAVIILRPDDTRGAPGPVTTMSAREVVEQRPRLSDDATLAAYLDRYKPRTLTEAAWSHAAAPVRAAVESVGPQNRGQARTYLSAVCTFLADAIKQQTWTGTDTPDLGVLLNDAAIEALVLRLPLRPASRPSMRSNLRRVSRSIGGAAAPKATQYRLWPDRKPDTFLHAAAPLPVSFVDVVASWGHLGHKPTAPNPLGEVVRSYRTSGVHTSHDLSTPTGTGETGDTVWSPALVRALTEAPNRQVTVSSNHTSNTQPGYITAPTAAPTAATRAADGDQTVGRALGAAAAKPTPPPSTTHDHVPTKPLSRRAELARAKRIVAERAEAAALEERRAASRPQDTQNPATGESLPTEDEFTTTEACRAALDAFVARTDRREVWNRNIDLGRVLVLAYEAASPRQVQVTCSHVAALLTWLDVQANGTHAHRKENGTTPRPLTLADVARPGTVEAFLKQAPWVDSSRATARSQYRRILARLDPATHRPAKLAYTKVLAPYSPEEVAQYVRIASHQPTLVKRRDLGFIVGLALGAGLDARDVRKLTPESLAEAHLPGASQPVLMVTVAGTGVRARTVPVRTAYAPLVRASLRLHTECGKSTGDLLLGRVSDRNNVTYPVVAGARTAVAEEKVEMRMSRLRASWLVAVMTAPISILDALAAAGLSSTRTMFDLLPYCPAPDAAHLDGVAAELARAAAVPAANTQPVQPVRSSK